VTEHEEGDHRRSRLGMGERGGWLVSATAGDELVSEGQATAPITEHEAGDHCRSRWGWASAV